MTSFRRRMRYWVTAWLVFQVASLSALVPRDCCADHRPTDTAKQSCHESVAATLCPMRSADGTPCPMHRGTTSTHGDHHQAPAHEHQQVPASEPDRAPANDCSLRGTCAGPMAALLALLQNQGVLPASVTVLPDATVRSVALTMRPDVVGRFEPPDPPPPRA